MRIGFGEAVDVAGVVAVTVSRGYYELSILRAATD